MDIIQIVSILLKNFVTKINRNKERKADIEKEREMGKKERERKNYIYH